MIAIGAAIATAGVAAISTVSTAGFSTSVIDSYSAGTTGAVRYVHQTSCLAQSVQHRGFLEITLSLK
jgi:hypothetical protein